MNLRLRPFLLTACTFLLALSLVFVFVEQPLRVHSPKKFAAIALRDNVSAFEKRGSALFTIPYLKKYYRDFYYLEAGRDWVPAIEFRPWAEKLLENNDSLDVFILSHGNLFYQWFTRMDTALRKKIRLVYNTGCNNDSQCVVYKNYNIRYYVGHSGENSLSPVFYVYFLRRLFNEKNVEEAVRSANARTGKTLGAFIGNQDTIAGSLGNYHRLQAE